MQVGIFSFALRIKCSFLCACIGNIDLRFPEMMSNSVPKSFDVTVKKKVFVFFFHVVSNSSHIHASFLL